MKRQKVETCFLPIELAEKGKQSSPFSESKATKNPVRPGRVFR
jgi:hypothetical protein